MAPLLGILLEIIVIIAVVTFVYTQIIAPAVLGEPLFPFKRKKRQALREDYVDAGAEHADAVLKAKTAERRQKTATLPDKLEPEPIEPVDVPEPVKEVDVKPKPQRAKRKARTRKATTTRSKK